MCFLAAAVCCDILVFVVVVVAFNMNAYIPEDDVYVVFSFFFLFQMIFKKLKKTKSLCYAKLFFFYFLPVVSSVDVCIFVCMNVAVATVAVLIF